MPKEIFLNLSEEKKKIIINAAKREFARVPFQETSIKNIVEDAGIARGSFYQYFESKEDLLEYIISNHALMVNKGTEETFHKTNGDIFEVFISIYDHVLEQCMSKEDIKLYKNIFENMKNSEDGIFLATMKKYKPKDISEYYRLINKENLKIENKEDMIIIIKMLGSITKNAIINSFSYNSKKQAKEEYLKMINYLKFGIEKKERIKKKC